MGDKIKKKNGLKKNIARIGLVAALLISLYFVSTVLSFKSPHGIDQLEGLYWQPQDTIDVAFMGTSHIHCGVNTGLLWDQYGIAAYDYSGAEQPLWMTYYYVKELYKYQTPEIIVLDLYGPAKYKEDYQYDWIGENIHGMKFSIDKLAMLNASIETAKIPQYFPSFAVYHNRYDEIEAEDFDSFFWNKKSKEAFKGYTPYWNKRPQERKEVFEQGTDGLTEKSEYYLKKIIKYVKKQGSELVLTVVPYVITNEDKKTYNRVIEIAAEEGIIFIDYNEYVSDMGLDFKTDFNDESHLNYWGSCKFTEYMGAFLDSYDRLPDRRGQAGYESWEEHAELILEELESYENGTLEQLEE